MMSSWYREIFRARLAPHRQAVQEFITTRQGYRLATSTGGVLTGRGADIILIDDPLKPDEALSETQRQACNEWFVHTLYSRLNDKRSGVIVIIMQRLYEDDLVGHVLEQEQWEVLNFPAIAEADEFHQIETIWGQRCFRRRQDEALHPQREPLEIPLLPINEPSQGVLPRIEAGCPGSARLPTLASVSPSRRRISMSPSTKLPT
jgi:hypothetical protein